VDGAHLYRGSSAHPPWEKRKGEKKKKNKTSRNKKRGRYAIFRRVDLLIAQIHLSPSNRKKKKRKKRKKKREKEKKRNRDNNAPPYRDDPI